ncbi:MAG: type I-B CRISPR-associated endonuclease Cas1b [Methanosarcinales archaeon]
MKKEYYITQSGRIKRKQNTVYFENEKIKKAIPINNINAIFALGEIDINSKLLVYLSQNNIPMHFFNHYGFYSGTYYPREYLNSGFLIVKQVEHYLDNAKRLEIAKEIIKASSHNILKNLLRYKSQGKDVSAIIDKIKQEQNRIDSTQDIAELMGLEGRIRDQYYQSLNVVLRTGFEFEKRVKRPPDNMINCLISFGNSLVYTTVLTEIYHTQLNPTISYLHEPRERRFSLSLDLSEIFKPILADKIIFNLINNQILKPEHFLKELNFCYLNENGKKLYLQEYDQKLKTTIMHRKLKRKVSYRRLIRLECYKLAKHLIGAENFEGFKTW